MTKQKDTSESPFSEMTKQKEIVESKCSELEATNYGLARETEQARALNDTLKKVFAWFKGHGDKQLDP